MTISRRQRVALLLCSVILISRVYTDQDSFRSAPTCRDAAVVDIKETRQIQASLTKLVKDSTFFSVFSVALDKQCPFWQDDAQCVIRECSVCHCSDNEIPPAWLRDKAGEGDCRDGESCTKGDKLNDVDRSLTGLAALVGQPVWHTADADRWTVRDEESEMMFVDLRKNPEQYTGYSGPSSRRIWQAVYDENCFMFSDKCRSGMCDLDTCKEERVLYTLISGLHASISMHIAKMYLHGETWGVNVNIYRERLRDHSERIANLNLAYAVVLRAVSKASAALHPNKYQYVTGNEENDEFTRKSIAKLFELPILQPGCEDKVFDESDMFTQANASLLPEFRNAFRNISMIMDCVGCEKCRLWGKLQFLGIGTALRILFEDETPELERNELIALMNVLHKLSTSVMWVDKMEDMIRRDAKIMARAGSMIAVVCLVLLALSLRSGKTEGRQKKPPSEESKRAEGTAESKDLASEVVKSDNHSEGLRERKVAKPE